MSEIFDYFQSLSTRENSSDNENFICCIKCFNHGINKIFSKTNVKELKSHLLEFHAIVLGDSKDNNSEKASSDTTIQTENNQIKEIESNKMSNRGRKKDSVWKFFRKDEKGGQLCRLCEEEEITTKYSAATSSTNLKLHLKNHGHVFDGDESTVDVPKTQTSLVWKYFCKPTRKGKIIDEEFVYCGKCLENGKKLRYSKRTSTTSLKRHLMVEHKLNIDDNESELTLNTTKINGNPKNNLEDVGSNSTKKVEGGSTRQFFEYHSDHSWCLICKKEGVSHKFSQHTSSTTLRRHLIIAHQINPHAHHDENTELLREFLKDVPEDTMEKAQKIVNIKSKRVKNYFLPIGQSVFCAFCLVKYKRRFYKPGTSETNLKLHLLKVHDFDIRNLDKDLINSVPILENPFNYDAITPEMIEQAKKIVKVKGLKTRRYFILEPNEMKLIFCAFCLSRDIPHKYANGTSATNLRLHLVNKHKVDPKHPDFYLENNDETFNDNTMSDFNDHLNEVDDVEEQFDDLNPVQSVLIDTPAVATEDFNTKYCRSCGRDDVTFFTKLTSILRIDDDDFQDHECPSFGDIYSEITGIQIYNDDGMSQVICYPCEANLKIAYHFKLMACKTEDKMIQKFNFDQPIDVESVKREHEEHESLGHSKRIRKSTTRDGFVEDFLEDDE